MNRDRRGFCSIYMIMVPTAAVFHTNGKENCKNGVLGHYMWNHNGTANVSIDSNTYSSNSFTTHISITTA